MGSLSSRQLELASKISTEAAATQWRDWRWQLKHTIRDINTFEELLGVRFDGRERRDLELTVARFPLAVTPYYLSLIDQEDWRNDPVYMQSFPQSAELVINQADMVDPLAEDRDSPVPNITHRYPDRVLFYVSGVCAMYCRHCTRKRKVGDHDEVPDRKLIEQGLDYIKRTPQVRDVLLSGGDPFLLQDERLDWILGELRRIEHVEVVRIGTRTPVVLPYRITDDLVHMLKQHHPVWVNTHFNHPRELTSSSREALSRLADAGIPLGNQTVLLRDVNDCPYIMKRLMQELLMIRVKPYYIYQCDLSRGIAHFRTSITKGMEIIENLRGHTTGMAVPTFVVDAPGGGGKIPVMPNYLLSQGDRRLVLRNYEGVITTYTQPENVFSDCGHCRICEDERYKPLDGVAKLLAGEKLTLEPADLKRRRR